MAGPAAPAAWYSEEHILFVMERQLHSTGARFCVHTADGAQLEVHRDLFHAPPSLLHLGDAALVLTSEGAPLTLSCLAPLLTPAPAFVSVSLCTRVDFRGLHSGTQLCTVDDVATAALQIKLWNSLNPDAALREHVICVSYQYRSAHWCLLLILLRMNVAAGDGATTVRSIQLHLFDPLSPTNELPLDARSSLRAQLASHLTVHPEVQPTNERLPLQLGGVDVVYAKQQEDGSSCGVITAANAASILANSLTALWERCPAGAVSLRAQHRTLALADGFTAFDAALQVAPVAQLPVSGVDVHTASRSFLAAIAELSHTHAAQGHTRESLTWDDAFNLLAANVSDDADHVGRSCVKRLLLQHRAHFETQHAGGLALFPLLLRDPPARAIHADMFWTDAAAAILERAAVQYFLAASPPAAAPAPPPGAAPILHQKGALTPSGLSGFLYQARVMSLYAWRAFEQQIEFELRAEDPAFGKVDDLLLFEKERIVVVQVKHSSGKQSYYSLQHLIDEKRDKKKAALVLYFDTWAELEEKRSRNDPLLQSRRRIDYRFITNHTLDSDLQGLYDPVRRRFSDAFLTGTSLTDTQKRIRCQLVDSIIQQSSYLRAREQRGFDLLNTFQLDLAPTMPAATAFVTNVLAPWFVKQFLAAQLAGSEALILHLPHRKDTLPTVTKFLPSKKDKKWHEGFLRAAFCALFQCTWRQDAASKRWHADLTLPASPLQHAFLECRAADTTCRSLLERVLVETKLDWLAGVGAALFLVSTGFDAKTVRLDDLHIDQAQRCARWVVPSNFAHWLAIVCGDQQAVCVPMGEALPAAAAPLTLISDALRCKLAAQVRKVFYRHPALRVASFDGTIAMPPLLTGFFQQFSFHYSYLGDAALSAELARRMRCSLRTVDPTYHLDFFWHVLDDLRQMATAGITRGSVQTLLDRTNHRVKQSHLTGYTERWTNFLHQEFSALAAVAAGEQLWPLMRTFCNAAAPQLLLLRCPKSEMLCVALAIADFMQLEREAASGSWALVEAVMCGEDDVALLDGSSALSHFMVVGAASLFAFDGAGQLQASVGTRLLDCAAASCKHLLLIVDDREEKLAAQLVERMRVQHPHMQPVTPHSIHMRFTDDQLRVQLQRAGDASLWIGTHSVLLGSLGDRPGSGLFHELRNPVQLALALRRAGERSAADTAQAAAPAAAAAIFVPLAVQVLQPSLSWSELSHAPSALLLSGSIGGIDSARQQCQCVADWIWRDLDALREKVTEVLERSGERLWLPPTALEECLQDACADRRNLITRHKQCFATWLKPESADARAWLEQHALVLAVCCDEHSEASWRLTDAASFELIRQLPPRRYQLERELKLPNEHAELLVRPAFPRRLVLVAFYGAGKTRFLRRLQEQHAELPLTAASFSWTVFLPLRTLCAAHNDMPLPEVLAQYLPPMSDLERAVFQRDCELHGVLLLLDGWDEMTPHQRAECDSILQKLFAYRYLLLSSRPSDETLIPLAPNEHLRLLPFKEGDIRTYVDTYFRREQPQPGDNVDTRVARVHELLQLWEHNGALALLGKPLLCRLMCDIVSERMRAGEVPADMQLTLATLFDEFIIISLRKYHRDRAHLQDHRFSDARIWQWSRRETELMRVTAFAHIFSEVDSPQESVMDPTLPDEETDRDITAIALMRPDDELYGGRCGYQFDHQTIAEYFVALQLLTLLARPAARTVEQWVRFFFSHFYQRRFQVVWTFLAGLACSRAMAERAMHSTQIGPCQGTIVKLLQVLEQLARESPDLVGPAAAAAFSTFACALDLATVRASVERVLSPSSRLHAELLRLASEWRQLPPLVSDHGRDDAAAVVDKSNLPHQIDAPDEAIVDATSYNKTRLTRATLEAAWSQMCATGYDFDKVLEKVRAKSSTAQLPTGALYSLAMSVVGAAVPRERVEVVVRELLRWFLADPEPLNTQTYQEAYLSLMVLVDAGRVPFAELAPELTRDFNQKYAVHDLVRRLKRAGLLTPAHVQLLFGTVNRFGRKEYWDYNVGLPLIVLIKDEMCDTMLAFALRNLLEPLRSFTRSGYADFEIGAAQRVLMRLSKVAFRELRHIRPMVGTLLKFIVLPPRELERRLELNEFRSNALSSYERAPLLQCIVEYFHEATAARSTLTLQHLNRAHACVQLLFYAATMHGLPVMLRDDQVHFGDSSLPPTPLHSAAAADEALPAQVAWQQLLLRFYFAELKLSADASGALSQPSVPFNVDTFDKMWARLHNFAEKYASDARALAPAFAMGAVRLLQDADLSSRYIPGLNATEWRDYLWPQLLRADNDADIKSIALQLEALPAVPPCGPPDKHVEECVRAWTDRLREANQKDLVQWLARALLGLARVQPARLDAILQHIDGVFQGKPQTGEWGYWDLDACRHTLPHVALFLSRMPAAIGSLHSWRRTEVRFAIWLHTANALARWRWLPAQAEPAVRLLLESLLDGESLAESSGEWSALTPLLKLVPALSHPVADKLRSANFQAAAATASADSDTVVGDASHEELSAAADGEARAAAGGRKRKNTSAPVVANSAEQGDDEEERGDVDEEPSKRSRAE